MNVNQIIDSVQQQSAKPAAEAMPRRQYDWEVRRVLALHDGLAHQISAAELSEYQGCMVCVIEASTHFPPRFSIHVGVYYNGCKPYQLRRTVGTTVAKDGSAERYGTFSLENSILLEQEAAKWVDEQLDAWSEQNKKRVASRSRQQQQPEHRKTGKTERDRLKKQKRAVGGE